MKKLAPVFLAAAALALPAAAHPATTVIREGDRVRLAGTTISCIVVRLLTGKPAISCLVLKGGSAVGVGSYSFVVSDAVAAANRFTTAGGSIKEVYSRKQPKLSGPYVDTSKGPLGRSVTMKLGDLAKISNTHMALSAGRNKSGALAFDVVIVDSKVQPVAGSYAGGISMQEVVILELFSKSGDAKVLFRRTHGK